jgi:hypothetical protein
LGGKPTLSKMPNGILVCTSGKGPFGKPQAVYVMLSLDGRGQKWEYPFVFYDGPGCGYTSNIERDGKLYVYYSQSDYNKPVGTYHLPYEAIQRAQFSIERIEK